MDTAGNFKDALGQRFGRALVVAAALSDRHGNARWVCKCDCGATFTATGFKLRRRHVGSCGCLAVDVWGKNATTHGMSHTRLFRIWTGIRTRCSNDRSEGWDNYGGRGIGLCSEWMNSFEAFHAWAIAADYSDGLTIDRKDNNGDYEPGNCRWATMSEQAQNTRRGRLPDGRRITDVASAHELKIGTVRERIRKGWDAELACTAPTTNRWHTPFKR